MSYRDDARSDAKETVAYFKDEIVGMLLEKGEASDDLFNDYPNGDSYHHENHTDKSYDLQEAAELLDELRDNEETDSGLWQGLEPREAVCAQAAYTYGNAVYAEWRELIEKINDEASDLMDDYDDRIRNAETEQEEAAEEGDEYDGDDPDDLRSEKNTAVCELVEEYT
jgi:hypothetical protein